jgi:ribosomal protein L7Ae-like RNA K-turn-binding protein
MPKTTSKGQLLGLALRAGALIHGEKIILEGFKKHPDYAVICACDVGDNMRQKVLNKAHHYNVLVDFSMSSEALALALGKARKCVALTNAGFIERFQALRQTEEVKNNETITAKTLSQTTQRKT